ncbi:hypothetical protein CO2235_60054 [Cupriavidus oxalaticus]|uniref:Uncharacterized protein n=1 Tax=Cupriavidus oxalaticus TaxID=96344 RepID=A0A976BEK7_9BURK|nr:hypothetical protein CO2235_60054 [Cupriavidus oxalaticus]
MLFPRPATPCGAPANTREHPCGAARPMRAPTDPRKMILLPFKAGPDPAVAVRGTRTCLPSSPPMADGRPHNLQQSVTRRRWAVNPGRRALDGVLSYRRDARCQCGGFL